MSRVRELLLVGGGVVLSAGLAHAGDVARAAWVLALGGVGALSMSWSGRARPRWPRLRRALGRELARADERLEPTLDAAEDALDAVAANGEAAFRGYLAPVATGVVELCRRALALSRVRAGHEATLARICLEAQATALERAARVELDRVGAELERLRGLVTTVGPSVRHVGLVATTVGLGAPPELAARLDSLREALTEAWCQEQAPGGAHEPA